MAVSIKHCLALLAVLQVLGLARCSNPITCVPNTRVMSGLWGGGVAGSQYRLLNPAYTKSNLLMDGSQQQKPTSIMFLGDSVDKTMMVSVCDLIGGEIKHWLGVGDEANYRILYEDSMGCWSDRFHMLFIHQVGVHKEGPWHNERNVSSWEASSHAVQVFEQHFGGFPDITIVSQNFWDIARIHRFEQDLWQEACMSNFPSLPDRYLASWQANFTDWLTHVRSELSAGNPSSPRQPFIVYHTTAHPTAHAENGFAIKPYLGNTYFVEQLNRVGAATAEAMGIPVVDQSALAHGIARNKALRDKHHPADFILFEAFNLALNLHRACHLNNGGADAAGSNGADAAADGSSSSSRSSSLHQLHWQQHRQHVQQYGSSDSAGGWELEQQRRTDAHGHLQQVLMYYNGWAREDAAAAGDDDSNAAVEQELEAEAEAVEAAVEEAAAEIAAEEAGDDTAAAAAAGTAGGGYRRHLL